MRVCTCECACTVRVPACVTSPATQARSQELRGLPWARGQLSSLDKVATVLPAALGAGDVPVALRAPEMRREKGNMKKPPYLAGGESRSPALKP